MSIIRCHKPTSLMHETRNGFVKTGGVCVQSFQLKDTPHVPSDNPDGEVMIEAVNSKGDISRARVVVHVSIIDDVITALQAAKQELTGKASAEPTDEDWEDWRYEVANGDTRLGIDEWLMHREEMQEYDPMRQTPMRQTEDC